MQNPAYDLQILQHHLVLGGVAVICTDQIDAWQGTALVVTFQSDIRLIPLELGDCARHVVAALDAYRAAGKMSVRVIIEAADRHALARVKDVPQQVGFWAQQPTTPKGMTVEFVIQPRSRSNEEMASLLNSFGAQPSSQS